MSMHIECLDPPQNEESEDDDEKRDRDFTNKLAEFNDTLNSSQDEMDDVGEVDDEDEMDDEGEMDDHVLDDDGHHSDESQFVSNENNVMDYPRGHPFHHHKMQTSTPCDNRQVPPLQTPQTVYVNHQYEDQHVDEDTCIDPRALQTPSTVFARDYRNPDIMGYTNYPPQTSRVERYQGQQDTYTGGHEGDHNTSLSLNNSASGFMTQHEDQHVDENTCIDPRALQTPSTAFARDYRNPDIMDYINYPPQTSRVEHYQGQQDTYTGGHEGDHNTSMSLNNSTSGFMTQHGGNEYHEDQPTAFHEGDYNTLMNSNNSASQLTTQHGGVRDEYHEDQTTALHGQHNLDEFSDACNRNDVLLDGNRRFYNEVGSTADGEIEKLKDIIEMQSLQIEKLKQSFKTCQDNRMSEARVSSHRIKILEVDNNKLMASLEDIKHELQSLDYEVNSLRAEKDELLKKYVGAEEHMAMMKSEIEGFKSADTLALMKQQYEDAFTELRQKHESDVTKLKRELQSFEASNQDKDEKIKVLQNDKEECARQYEKDKLERVDTINKLTRALNESQDQCQQMLLKGGNTTWSFGHPSLEETRLKHQEAESLNTALKEENENLKLRLAVKEEMLLNDLVNEISQKKAQLKAADYSYAQLNINRTDIDMEQLESFFSSKVTSIEKLMSLYTTVKSRNATLREDLRRAQDEQKRMVKEFESAKNSLKEISCDGSCASASALNKEIKSLKAEIKKLSSSKKKLESEMTKKDELIYQLEDTIGEHETRTSQLVAEFNEDKKKALDNLELGWAEKFRNAIEAHKSEVYSSLSAELESSRKQLLETEVQLSRAQQDYLECCEDRKHFEKELNLAWEKKVEEMKKVHVIQLSSLKEICSLNLKKFPETVHKDSSIQVEVVVASKCIQVGMDVASKAVQVGDDMSTTAGLKEAVVNLQTNLKLEKEKHSKTENAKLQLEKNFKDSECKINELKQLVDKSGKELEGMRSACLNIEKQNRLQATKMKQKAEDDLLTIVMDLIKRKGKLCEVSFKETWTWVQKIEHLLSVLPENKTEVLTKEHESIERYLDLKKKIEEYEKESITYIGQNIELNNQNSKLSEELNQAGVEVKKLRKMTGENEQDIIKLKEALEKYRCERRSLYANTKKLEAKIQGMEKCSNETRLKLDSEKDEQIKSLLENETFLQNNLHEALEKLSDTRKSLEELDECSKKRLNDMMKSMDREKEEIVKQLKKCFKMQLTQKEKEKKILDELLKDSEHRSQKEIRVLKKKLEDVVDEKIALEKCDLGDQMKKYKDSVEEARRFYNERVHALEVEKKKYKRARDKVSSTVKQHYIRHMREFLRGRFDSSSAVEIMAHVEVYLDGIPSLIPNEDVPPSDLSQPSHRNYECANQRSTSPASTISSLTSRPPIHPLSFRPSSQASDVASSYRFYTRGTRDS